VRDFKAVAVAETGVEGAEGGRIVGVGEREIGFAVETWFEGGFGGTRPVGWTG
jgi:hypothetical protein